MTAEVGAGLPDMAAAAAALEVSTQYSSPALLNHSVRSYLWGRAYAAANGIDFDAELLGEPRFCIGLARVSTATLSRSGMPVGS